jgi:hypothetical protein
VKTATIALSAAALVAAALIAAAPAVFGQGSKTPSVQHNVSKQRHPGVSGYALRREKQAKVSKKGYPGAFGYAPREPSGSTTDFILSRQFGGGSM